jgi:hypothetical protein
MVARFTAFPLAVAKVKAVGRRSLFKPENLGKYFPRFVGIFAGR